MGLKFSSSRVADSSMELRLRGYTAEPRGGVALFKVAILEVGGEEDHIGVKYCE